MQDYSLARTVAWCCWTCCVCVGSVLQFSGKHSMCQGNGNMNVLVEENQPTNLSVHKLMKREVLFHRLFKQYIFTLFLQQTIQYDKIKVKYWQWQSIIVKVKCKTLLGLTSKAGQPLEKIANLCRKKALVKDTINSKWMQNIYRELEMVLIKGTLNYYFSLEVSQPKVP